MLFSFIRTLPCLLLAIIFSCQPSNKVGGLVGVDENPAFENTWWELIDYNGKPPLLKANIKFRDPAHTIEGFAGCNQISGSYERDGHNLAITPLSTKKACTGKMEAESAFLGLLQMADSFELSGRQLLFKNGEKVIATFTILVRKQI